MISEVALILLAVYQITTVEPKPAQDWHQSITARCGNTALALSGYGRSTNVSDKASILINGRALTGDLAGRLVEDLSNPRAAYRISVLCDVKGQMMLRLNRGEARKDGQVDYSAASAVISNGTLVDYNGLHPTDASSFWFR